MEMGCVCAPEPKREGDWAWEEEEQEEMEKAVKAAVGSLIIVDAEKHPATSAEDWITEDRYASDSEKLGYFDLDKLCPMDTDSTAENEKLPLPLPQLKRKRDCSPESAGEEDEAIEAIQIVRNFIPTCSDDVEKQRESSTGGPITECSRSDSSGKMGSLDVLCPVGTDGAATKEKLPLPELKSVSNSEHQSSAYLTWEKVVQVLYIVRRHRISEYDPKRDAFVPIHFCSYNISFFDFKRESNVGLGDPLHKLPSSQWKSMVDSVNVISLKVLQSDVGYPISLYGTVIARDEIDYRCVYLFRRCRDDPQVIKSPKDMLTLTGPHRGLAVLDSMFFEVDLKIKDGRTVDKDFSKGVIVHNAVRKIKRPTSKVLISRLSEVELLYAPVPYAMEATLAVNILDGPFPFRGKLTAWTADKNHIILYDSEAPGTLTPTRDGPDCKCVVPLSRSLVAVPLDETLMLHIRALDGKHKARHLTTALEKSDGKHDFICGSYKLQVMVTWTTGITYTRFSNSKWLNIGGDSLLL